MADAEFKTIDRGKARIKAQLEKAHGFVALIGIPGTAKPPKGKDGKPATINMATLAYIMEKGSPVNNLDPRPFMEKTRKRVEGKFAKLAARLYKNILAGKTDAITALKDLGARYEGEMKNSFTQETFKGNAQITINGGWMKNKVSGKVFKVEGKKSTRPLINNGALRDSILSKVQRV